jgi:acetyl esterase/lipase
MDAPSSLTVTTRSDLSVLYGILRTVIRPLRPRLVKPGKPLPAGSPKLNPPRNISGIKEHESSNGLYLYTFSSPTSNPHPVRAKHNIFYFAGGGFQSPPSSEHWKTCRELGTKLAEYGYAVTLVSYPLAPHTPAPESLPILRTWLREVCDVASRNGESVTLAGDSAGGNVVLNLGLWWADEAVKGGLANPVKQILAVSPATDLRNENAGIKEADARDPVLSVGLTTDVGKGKEPVVPLSLQ